MTRFFVVSAMYSTDSGRETGNAPYPRLAVLSLLVLAGLLNACNIAKHLPAKERLYMGTDIVMKADSTISKTDRQAVNDQLMALARPRPNKQLFGFPYKVGFYYFVGEPKKPNGFRAKLRRKFGEEPVFASAKAISSSIPIWEASMNNEGYFGSQVSGQFKEEGYKARGVYTVDLKPRFYVDSVAFYTDSVATVADSLRNTTIRRRSGSGRRGTARAFPTTPANIQEALQQSARRTVIKKGDPFRLDVIKIERERIGQSLKQRGFYYFIPDYVGVLADNDSVAHRTTLIFYVKPDMPQAAGVPYSIRNVFIYPNYNLSTARQDTNQRRAYQTTEQFNVVDSSRRFDPRLFRDVVTMQPGSRYNARQQDLTLSRLINVGAFKFVRNRFDPDQQGDSAVLDVHYYLTPYPEKSARVELDGTSRSNNFTGSQVILSWRDRNTLRRAELLTLNANAGIEFQLGLGNQSVTNYRLGADATLSFPRLVSPVAFRYDQRQALPKTNITLSYQTIIRGNLYNLNSFQATYGYAWRQNQQIEHSLQPLNVTFVRPSNISQAFIDSAADNPFVFRQYANIARSEQLILSTLYTFNYNSPLRTNKPTTYRLTANAEASGNLANLLVRNRDSYGDKVIFNVPFAQYLRFDVDARLYRKLAQNLTLANRFFGGLGITYGNSSGRPLPLVRQYFVGGSNSIRAFRPRAIGPGLFTRDTIRNALLFQDGGGDIRLEANTELRAKFTQYIEGAVFVDAGNVWSYSDVDTFGPEAKFGSDFYKQIAIGTGVGIRIDLSYFLIRLDLATPLRKPYKTNGSEWVINQIDFGSRDWRKQNLVFNIGVGYPF